MTFRPVNFDVDISKIIKKVRLNLVLTNKFVT